MNLSAPIGHLSRADQCLMIEEVRSVLETAPLVRCSTIAGRPMSVRVSAAGRLGWDGRGGYKYGERHRNGLAWPEIPVRWLEFADHYMGPQPWDSAVINWYDAGAKLGWHRDIEEYDHSYPIIIFSIGDSASWAVRDGGGPVYRSTIESGSVTALHGSSRLCEHTVERIVHSPLLSPLDVPGRISVTLRVAGEPWW